MPAVQQHAERRHHCTMQASSALCRLPGPYGLRWPGVDAQLHHHLFGQGMGAAHTALVDVWASARCVLERRRRGVIA